MTRGFSASTTAVACHFSIKPNERSTVSDATAIHLEDFIRAIPDFPKPGILFRDITPLLASAQAFAAAIDAMAARLGDRQIDAIAAAEARGFIFAAPLALKLQVPLVPIRKPGKLPAETLAYSYELEYGTDTLEIHADAFPSGSHVLVVDDLLATGGTIAACCKLVQKAGGRVAGCAFLIELSGLKGRNKIEGEEVISLIRYE